MSFRNPIVGDEELLRSAVRSEDYVAGAAGWRIARNGDAEFNEGTFRGSVTATRFEAIYAGIFLNTNPECDGPTGYTAVGPCALDDGGTRFTVNPSAAGTVGFDADEVLVEEGAGYRLQVSYDHAGVGNGPSLDVALVFEDAADVELERFTEYVAGGYPGAGNVTVFGATPVGADHVVVAVRYTAGSGASTFDLGFTAVRLEQMPEVQAPAFFTGGAGETAAWSELIPGQLRFNHGTRGDAAAGMAQRLEDAGFLVGDRSVLRVHSGTSVAADDEAIVELFASDDSAGLPALVRFTMGQLGLLLASGAEQRLWPPYYCSLAQANAQTITTGTTTVCDYSTAGGAIENWDSDTMHDGGGALPNRIIAPGGAGDQWLVLAWAIAEWAAGSAVGRRITGFRINAGTPVWGSDASPNNTAAHFTQAVMLNNVVGGDGIDQVVFHDRGANENVTLSRFRVLLIPLAMP